MTEQNGYGARLARIEEKLNGIVERIEMANRDASTIAGLRFDTIAGDIGTLRANAERDASRLREEFAKVERAIDAELQDHGTRLTSLEAWANNFKGRAAAAMGFMSLAGGGLVAVVVKIVAP